ncbi:MAG TPA: hypothetical protein VGY58_09770 [Gemmataceae bacterium]|nr:hypothetical protein [Gemmataceae bacterium]
MRTPRTPLPTRSAASRLNIEALEERWLLSAPGIPSAPSGEFSHSAIAANGLREDIVELAYAWRANEDHSFLIPAEKTDSLTAANAVLVDELFAYAERRALAFASGATLDKKTWLAKNVTSFLGGLAPESRAVAEGLLLSRAIESATVAFGYGAPAHAQTDMPYPAATLPDALSGATLDTKTWFANKLASFLGRLDPEARADAELLLRRAIGSDIAAVGYVAQAHMLTDMPYEAATLPDVATLPFGSEGRSEAPRDPVTPDVKSSGAGLESHANDRDLFPVSLPLPSGDAAPARLKRAATTGRSLREPGQSVPVFAPVAAGLLGDIFTVDVVALEQGMQNFLREIGTLGDRLLSVRSGNRSACWFVAGVVAGAMTLEAVRWRFQRPALDRNGVSREDSAWIYRSSFSDLPVDDDA